MINFFRKTRRNLATENKFGRYLRYAIGEVILIMLGIFMALQLQNWNANRKQEKQFKTTLEQLYNTLNDDQWHYNNEIIRFKNVIQVTDSLLNINEDNQEQDLIMGIWYLSMFNNEDYPSESIQIIENLKYNSGNPEQSNLVKQLLSYNKLISVKSKSAISIVNEVPDYLLQRSIAFPGFNYEEQGRGLIFDSTYYNTEDFKNAIALLQDKEFRSHVKSQRTQRAFQVLDYKSLRNDAKSIIRIIKDYHPDAKLLFQDVGIIGTSIDGFDDVGARSTPMILVDKENSIWEIELYLKVGAVKFRCRDSWAINWGGDSFPKGDANREWEDIEVSEAGNYRVILNLTENTYEFIKLDDD